MHSNSCNMFLTCILQAVGLAHLDAASHLCLHPKYGPWFSLRALLVFDGVPFHGEPTLKVICAAPRAASPSARWIVPKEQDARSASRESQDLLHTWSACVSDSEG
jgi:hypothetical protein